MALADIEKGELLVFCPMSIVIQPATQNSGATVSPAAQFLRTLAKPPSSFIQTVLLVMHEQALATSFWAPYLGTLADLVVDAPQFWAAGDRRHLAGTALQSDPAEPASMEEALFKERVLPIMQQRPALWPAAVQVFGAFQRAVAAVTSRAFHGDAAGCAGPFMVLAPF